MELSDLLSLFDERQETAPPPPLFVWSELRKDFWPEHFDTANGIEAWRRLCEHAGDLERAEALVSTNNSSALIRQPRAGAGDVLVIECEMAGDCGRHWSDHP